MGYTILLRDDEKYEFQEWALMSRWSDKLS